MRKGPPWWANKFIGRGCRITFPRQIILELLGAGAKHYSAEEIYIAIHKTYPGIGITTVYRTLELLVKMGLVNKFDFGDKRARYEIAEGPQTIHHHHLICTECGRIVDYSDFVEEEVMLLSKVEAILKERHKFTINSHQIHFYGTCEKCRGAGK